MLIRGFRTKVATVWILQASVRDQGLIHNAIAKLAEQGIEASVAILEDASSAGGVG
jgi:hypothetical protein